MLLRECEGSIRLMNQWILGACWKYQYGPDEQAQYEAHSDSATRQNRVSQVQKQSSSLLCFTDGKAANPAREPLRNPICVRR